MVSILVASASFMRMCVVRILHSPTMRCGLAVSSSTTPGFSVLSCPSIS